MFITFIVNNNKFYDGYQITRLPSSFLRKLFKDSWFLKAWGKTPDAEIVGKCAVFQAEPHPPKGAGAHSGRIYMKQFADLGKKEA